MKIAVVYSNGLGNLILLTPMLRAIRDHHPSAEITLIVVTDGDDPRWSTIFDLARCYEGRLMDRVWACDRSPLGMFAADIKPEDFDVRIVPVHGEPSRVRDAFLAAGAVTGRTPDWTAQHEVESNMECAWALGYRGATPALVPPEPAFLETRRHIAICNGAKAVPIFERKRWDVAKWREVARLAHLWTGDQVAVLGGEQEREEAEAICAGRPWMEAATTGNLAHTSMLVSTARVLITTDTFTMHLGAAFNTPLVALFGPTLVTKNHPWMPRDRYEIVRSGVECQPCQATAGWHTCAEPRCMTELEVGDVMAAVRRVLKRTERPMEAAA